MAQLNSLQVTNQTYTDGTKNNYTITGTSSDIRVTANFNEDNTFKTRGLFNLLLESADEDGSRSIYTKIDLEYVTQGSFEIDGDSLILNRTDFEIQETYAIDHISNNRLETITCRNNRPIFTNGEFLPNT